MAALRHARRLGLIGILLAACVACAGDDAGEQQAKAEIRELQQRWVEAVAEGDVDTIVDFYAEDAYFLPSGSTPLIGHEAIRGWWQQTFKNPPFISLRFEPVRIQLSENGDMASDVGTSRSVSIRDGEQIEQRGKYVVVWQRIDGEWQATADIFNSN